MKIIRVNKLFPGCLSVKGNDWLSELCMRYLLAQETKSASDIAEAKENIRKALNDAPGYEGLLILLDSLDRKTVKFIRRRPPHS